MKFNGQESCPCTDILCMHKNLVHAQENVHALKSRILLSEVGGGSLAPPTGKSFRFVCACVRAVLVKSFRSENVPVTACIFYLWAREVVSCILCGFRFCVNSNWVLNDFLRVLVSYQWALVSSQCYYVSLVSWEFNSGLIEFPWVLSEFLRVLLSSDEFKRGLSESRWVLSEFLWALVSSTEFL